MVLRRITLYFILLFVLVGVGLFVYSNLLINRLEDEYRSVALAYADVSSAILSATEVPQGLLDEIVESLRGMLDFPAVVTTVDGRIVTSRNMPGGLKPVDSDSRLEILRIAKEMDEANEPVSLVQRKTHRATGEVFERELFRLHYRLPDFIRSLAWVPGVGIGFIILFGGLGLYANHRFRLSQQQAIWVGLAKETAHQLGTPVSSLLGWLELLKDDPASLPDVLPELASDIGRLEAIVNRFAVVGSAPELEPLNPRPVVEEAVEYCRKRISLANVALKTRLEDTPPVPLNPILFGWVLENLIRNAAEAGARTREARERRVEQALDPGVSTPVGSIEVTLERRGDLVVIKIADDGPGMTRHMRRHAFDAGKSSKHRGWGLGLTLAKRIISDYHHGRISVDSRLGEGTTFTIELAPAGQI
ncbi:MAG: hypothetical protein GF399_01140 [Candidatus Coatesbacteria bacterium]|nr:hypothetical protein [Candidatus Coatesbacteria bacterium]